MILTPEPAGPHPSLMAKKHQSTKKKPAKKGREDVNTLAARVVGQATRKA